MLTKKMLKCKHERRYWSLEYKWYTKNASYNGARTVFSEDMVVLTNIDVEEHADREARKKYNIPSYVPTDKYECCFDCGMHHLDSIYLPPYADKL